MWTRLVNYLKRCRDRLTLWAYRMTHEPEPDEESDDEYDLTSIEPDGRGMRTEMVLRAVINLPFRWFKNTHHARKLERSLNQAHPECPVRVKVIDTLVGNEFYENVFDFGLLVIPLLFLVSFALWAVSRFAARYMFELLAFITVVIAIGLFIVFGLIFVFVAFSGYEFEYLNGRKFPKRKRNPRDSYNKIA